MKRPHIYTLTVGHSSEERHLGAAVAAGINVKARIFSPAQGPVDQVLMDALRLTEKAATDPRDQRNTYVDEAAI